MAAYGVLPTDPRFIDMIAEPHLLYFAYWYMKKNKREMFDKLEQILGTTWTQDDLNPPKKPGKASDDFFTPLSLVIRPDLLDRIRKLNKIKKTVQSGDSVVETSDLPKEQWDQFAQIVFANFGRIV